MTAIQLTEEQEQIVRAKPGHYVITAVAGSGKTTTLAHRIRYLLDSGIDHRRMLVLMFNKAAQQDFTSKLGTIIPDGQQAPEVRTFHAMGYRLYQRFVSEGFLPSFQSKIISEKEQQYQLWLLIMRHVDKALLPEIKRNKKEHIDITCQFIESVKGTLKSPEIIFEALNLDSKFRYIIDLFHHFEEWRQLEQRISYADMLYDPVMAIRKHPALLKLVENKMDVVLVDEYQDTNDIQHELLKIIAGNRAKVTVVGDPDQTIYEFRGAKPDYMLTGFQAEFNDARALSLSYSFRYGHQVALLANHLITRNSGRRDIICKAHASNFPTDVHVHAGNKKLISIIKQMTSEAQNQCAILCRVWSQTVGIELALLANSIPYQMPGHAGVFFSDEAECIFTILELATGQFQHFSPVVRQQKLERLCRFPHVGVPEYQLKELTQALAQQNEKWGSTLLGQIPAELKKIQSIKLERLARALSSIECSDKSAAALLQAYINTSDLYEGIRSLSLSLDQAEEKIASIQGLVGFVCKLPGHSAAVLDKLRELQHMAASQPQTKGVQLTTIHRAKGLEWETIHIPGLQDNTYPYLHHKQGHHKQAHQKDKNITQSYIESERRLLYVAMTRAIKALHLFPPHPENPNINASRFQYEMMIEASLESGKHFHASNEDDRINVSHIPTPIIKKYADHLGKQVICDTPTQTPGKGLHQDTTPIWFADRVTHSLLGEGRVVNEQGASFTVEFSNQDTKIFSKETAHRFFSVA